MKHSKLILIEGIPGSGKTTTAQYACTWLARYGIPTALFLEGDWNHPADFESVACLNDHQYSEIQLRFPEHARLLAQNVWKENGDWFLSYRKIQHVYGEKVPGEIIEALSRFEIYELPIDKFMNLLLQRWQTFSTKAACEETVYVFECCFLQNPITTLLARHDLPAHEVCEYMMSLSEIISPLRPKLIYLAQEDTRATLETIRSKRPQEWANHVTWYLTGQAYGKARGLHGYDGVIDFYTMRQMFELEILRVLPTASTVITNNADWDERYKAVAAFLES